ncbi:MAG: cell division protein FtsZ [Ruminiclostridium sp.]|nr:cell division protein FtsZ [Ruminiclostridium sp.]MBR4111674.1 cell division protein FtsZ [Ruminiclostridium sp.]
MYNIQIKVFGVGGGGGNAVANMAQKGLRDKNAKDVTDDDVDIEFVVVNTDVAALKDKDKTLMRRVQIGRKCAKGRGAGGRAEVGAEAAREDREEVEKYLKGASLVFISAGMGGGTGTGAAPVIAEIARDMGILTVGVVTKPFEFEREQKMNQAMKGIDEMRKHVDALVIIPNQRLLQLNEKQLTFQQAFVMVDDVLHRTVKIVSDMVNKTAVINVDFSDLSTIIKDAGDAHIAIGTGTGDKKVEEAVQQVVNSPLLETSIKNAGRLLTYITLSQDALMTDVNDAMQAITKACGADAEIIFGANYGPADMKDSITISVIATCFKEDAQVSAAPSVADEIIGSSVGASTGSSFADFLSGTKTLSTDDSGYSDLEAIFKNRN